MNSLMFSVLTATTAVANGGHSGAPLIVDITEDTLMDSALNIDQWKEKVKEFQDRTSTQSGMLNYDEIGKLNNFIQQKKEYTAQQYEVHEPFAIEVEDDACSHKLPKEERSPSDPLYNMEMAVYRNCQFRESWINYWTLVDRNDPMLLDTEYKFATSLWSDRFGPWYQSCFPNDSYFGMWPGVNGDLPTGEDNGKARCKVTSRAGGLPSVYMCECYPLSDEYKYETLSEHDVDLVMNGNCSTDEPNEDCVKGAKRIAFEHQWDQGMTWMAILTTLDDILELYAEGFHLNVEDVYYLNRHYPELLKEDCTSCQHYAAMRPMPYIEGVDYNFVRDDMVSFGKLDPADNEDEG